MCARDWDVMDVREGKGKGKAYPKPDRRLVVVQKNVGTFQEAIQDEPHKYN